MAQGDLQLVALPGASSASIPATRGTVTSGGNWRRSAAILQRLFSRSQPETGDFAADPRESALLRHSLLRGPRAHVSVKTPEVRVWPLREEIPASKFLGRLILANA